MTLPVRQNGPIAPADVFEIVVSQEDWQIINYITQTHPTEWQWWMEVSREFLPDQGVYRWRLSNLYIPKQFCQGDEVESDPTHRAEMFTEIMQKYTDPQTNQVDIAKASEVVKSLTAWCHSHVKMPTDPSSTDLATFATMKEDHKANKTPIIAIIVNRSGDVYTRVYDGTIGKTTMNNVPFRVEEPAIDIVALNELIKTRLLPKPKPVTTVTTYGGAGNFQGGTYGNGGNKGISARARAEALLKAIPPIQLKIGLISTKAFAEVKPYAPSYSHVTQFQDLELNLAETHFGQGSSLPVYSFTNLAVAPYQYMIVELFRILALPEEERKSSYEQLARFGSYTLMSSTYEAYPVTQKNSTPELLAARSEQIMEDFRQILKTPTVKYATTGNMRDKVTALEKSAGPVYNALHKKYPLAGWMLTTATDVAVKLWEIEEDGLLKDTEKAAAVLQYLTDWDEWFFKVNAMYVDEVCAYLDSQDPKKCKKEKKSKPYNEPFKATVFDKTIELAGKSKDACFSSEDTWDLVVQKTESNNFIYRLLRNGCHNGIVNLPLIACLAVFFKDSGVTASEHQRIGFGRSLRKVVNSIQNGELENESASTSPSA